MAKIKPSSRSKAAAKPAPPTRLQNLAARPSYDDMTLGDDQLVDNSGVFRVTSSIAQAQAGHEDEPSPRFASDSLVMAAQRDGFRDEGPTINDVVEESSVEDEATQALRRERLTTLAARARARTKRR
jgi:hypothetical protein